MMEVEDNEMNLVFSYFVKTKSALRSQILFNLSTNASNIL